MNTIVLPNRIITHNASKTEVSLSHVYVWIPVLAKPKTVILLKVLPTTTPTGHLDEHYMHHSGYAPRSFS